MNTILTTHLNLDQPLWLVVTMPHSTGPHCHMTALSPSIPTFHDSLCMSYMSISHLPPHTRASTKSHFLWQSLSLQLNSGKNRYTYIPESMFNKHIQFVLWAKNSWHAHRSWAFFWVGSPNKGGSYWILWSGKSISERTAWTTALTPHGLLRPLAGLPKVHLN